MAAAHAGGRAGFAGTAAREGIVGQRVYGLYRAARIRCEIRGELTVLSPCACVAQLGGGGSTNRAGAVRRGRSPLGRRLNARADSRRRFTYAGSAHPLGGLVS